MAKKGLGNGLGALFAEKPVFEEAPRTTEKVLFLPLTEVQPNPRQPRQHFAEAALRELADSVAAQGILQPLLVRPLGEKSYEIIAGERRYRAAKLAGLQEVPCIIRDFSDAATLEVALMENIQRQDLNPMEEAISYQELLEQYGYTQQQLASKLGKSRVYIANMVRLLALPKPIQEAILAGSLSVGHGKALLQLKKESDRLALAEKILAEHLSVRQAEEYSKNPALLAALPKPKPAAKAKQPAPPKPATVDDLVLQEIGEKLRSKLGTKVQVQKNSAEQGKIILEYYSLSDLDRILQLLLPNETF